MPALTPEFTVNQYGDQWQENPDIAVLKNGNFVVVWRSFFADYDADIDSYYIGGRIYSPDGTPVSGEKLLSLDVLYASYPQVAALHGGGFAVAYEGNQQGLLNQDDIWVTSFKANGRLLTETQRVNSPADDYFFGAEVVGRKDGGYTVLFSGPEPDEADGTPASSGIFARSYDADGRATTPVIHVNESHLGEQMNARAVRLTNGNIAVVFDSEYTMPNPTGGVDLDETRLAILDPKGRPTGVEVGLHGQDGVNGGFALSDTEMAVTALSRGRFVVTWYETILDAFPDGDTGYGIFGQVYNSRGRAVSDAFTVGLHDHVPEDSSVAALDGGGFVVVHSVSKGADFPYDDVFYRLFDDDGDAVGGNVRVNTRRGGDQTEPTVAALPGGDFVVAWQSDAADREDEGIAARIFSGLRGRDADAAAARAPGDRLFGTADGETIRGMEGDDTISGRGGDDVLFGRDGDDRLSGGGGDDVLFGRDGDDRLSGGGGDDRLVGGKGDDTLTGGAGADTLVGGAGRDLYVVPAGTGPDLIEGFQGGRDELRIDAALWGDADLSRRQVVEQFAEVRGDTIVIDFGGDDAVTITGVTRPNAFFADLAIL